ncbi:5-methylcytosine restriction system component-like protein [Marinobacter santoriniensis NKSG1]|uniref:5-methylcytosine restriction system component-like protein n=2 Tax=Marinobacter santoriniensis TaxID=523742 RepID=M7CXS0_9GAMM|nr:5-methylcytosine restriction system component-like protein [Marinobacter santoriniensis NKSG1]
MDVGQVSNATFDWLMDLHQRWNQDSKLVIRNQKQYLKLGSYVGYLQSPSGEGIEILPKTEIASPQRPESLRALLQEMLACSHQLPFKEGDAADLARSDIPLHEWIISQFLIQLTSLVKRGLRFDYQNVEEESRFVRGQLDVGKQSRQSPSKAVWFNIRHDVFSPNRIENRLLKTALDYVLKLTKDSHNWRMANTLAHQLSVINSFRKPLPEIAKWQDSKLMQPYRSIKPWCVLVLEQLNPNFQHGLHSGIAMLFPMEQLFENYVSHHLRKSLPSDAKITAQTASQYLVHHSPDGGEEKAWFQLKPDLLLSHVGLRTVMDCKWKLLNSTQSTAAEKYGISQADLYQLFAYGQKYQNGHGHMVLIYPRHSEFQEPLAKLSFSEHLHLWCVPFDLHQKKLVPGDWIYHVPALSPDEPSKRKGFLSERLESLDDVAKVLGGKSGTELWPRLNEHFGLEGELQLIRRNAAMSRSLGDPIDDYSDEEWIAGFEYFATEPRYNYEVSTGMLLLPLTVNALLRRLRITKEKYQKIAQGQIASDLGGISAHLEENVNLRTMRKRPST